MLLNHQRETARQNLTEDSRCPECDGALNGRRGQVKTWHWAHKSLGDCSGGGEETEWHLAMKTHCLSWPAWWVEFPVKINGQQYFLDAHNPETGDTLEFVHSLSPFYEAKHVALKASGFNVLWIFDGAEFAAANRVERLEWPCRTFNFLKPAAFLMQEKLQPFVRICDGHVFWESLPPDPRPQRPAPNRTVTIQSPDGPEEHSVVDCWMVARHPLTDRLVQIINA